MPRLNDQWVSANGWIYNYMPEPARGDRGEWRWQRKPNPIDPERHWTLEWYDDATRSWDPVWCVSNIEMGWTLEEIYERVYDNLQVLTS